MVYKICPLRDKCYNWVHGLRGVCESCCEEKTNNFVPLDKNENEYEEKRRLEKERRKSQKWFNRFKRIIRYFGKGEINE